MKLSTKGFVLVGLCIVAASIIILVNIVNEHFSVIGMICAVVLCACAVVNYRSAKRFQKLGL